MDCQKDYHALEIREMETKSKERKAMLHKFWKQQNRKKQPEIYKKQIEKFKIERRIDTSISQLTDWYGPHVIQNNFCFYQKLAKVQKALIEIILFATREREEFWNEDLFDKGRYTNYAAIFDE